MIRILDSAKLSAETIFARNNPCANVEATVSAIIEDVKQNGDEALLRYCKKFDKADLSSLLVTKAEMDAAIETVEPEFLAILQKAAANIRRFHEQQVRQGFTLKQENGVITGQKITPIDRAGLYVPGGTAAYPSTVLMDAIPAKIAGCAQIVMTTPPNPDGTIAPVILAAAKIAGVDTIIKAGGAQAIAALAYGTESVPKVDKIVGPGNAYVAEAKKQVFGQVSIDMIAGPSEILIIADELSDPRHLAADLLSQAEHDKMASAVLVTPSESLALAVQQELENQIPRLARAAIARASIDGNGKIILCRDIAQAIEISNKIAPEHLELCVDEPFPYLDSIRHAGSIFLGRNCPEALGDYFAGPNHTLPTGGTARFSSPLGVDDFIKKTQFTYYTRQALADVAKDVAAFATAEGLTGHAASALIRTEEDAL